MPSPLLQRIDQPKPEEQDVCVFAETTFRNQLRRFGIKTDDRRRHMYVIGKTGMGKTTLLENMVLHDIYAGHGLGLIDPHGDFAQKIINHIPPKRINDVVYFNPADQDHPIGFNVLEIDDPSKKHLVASGLMGIFKKIWPDVWSPRMEYILNNTLLALLDYPGSTLLGINRLLSDKVYRRKVVAKISDPIVKAFWQIEFASYSERYATEAVASIQNKVGQFLSSSVIRNMVAQVKSTINVRDIMDSRKIFIVNLSKGEVGEENMRLLGGMLITKIQLAAMERVDTPEHERQDFFLYVDEFQNFATTSFANILSEARKYRLSLILAHQYIKQLEEPVRDAVFGNMGTMITFRVGADDAEMIAKELAPIFTEEDVVNLPKTKIFLRLMIDGIASQPFSAQSLPPLGVPTDSAEKVIRVTRERYTNPRDVVEDKVQRWSGLDGGDEEAAPAKDDGGGGKFEDDPTAQMFQKQPKPLQKKEKEEDKIKVKDDNAANMPFRAAKLGELLLQKPAISETAGASAPESFLVAEKKVDSLLQNPAATQARGGAAVEGEKRRRKRKRRGGGGSSSSAGFTNRPEGTLAQQNNSRPAPNNSFPPLSLD